MVYRMEDVYRTMRDPYEVLGVSRSASPDEIKSAYRKLAKKNIIRICIRAMKNVQRRCRKSMRLMIRSPIRKNIEIRPINNNPIRMETRIRIHFSYFYNQQSQQNSDFNSNFFFYGPFGFGGTQFQRTLKKAMAPSLEILFY